MARHPGIVFRALSWNLFHGRDFPQRSVLSRLRPSRPLLDEFVAVLGREEWEIALLQEAPPRWFGQLCERLGAHGAILLTSRNLGAPVRRALADRWPDLMASNEGGSNQILVRPPWRIADTRRFTLARLPERRRVLWARLERPDALALGVANLHASQRPGAAAAELRRAAEWVEGERLLLGGDLNLRPASDSQLFADLERRLGLAPPTAPTAIDHLLSRGLEILEPPQLLPPAAREVETPDGRRLRLSDHAPAAARFRMR